MKKCKNCETNDAIKYSKYASGNFCSIKCARSFSTKEKRKEISEKVSNKLKGKPTGINNFTIEKRIEFWKKRKNEIQLQYNKDILNSDYATLSFERLKKRIVLEQNGKCDRCNLDKWLGEDITLELEHIDGNHHNNKRDNLKALCPNCHSLTPTWRGRNKSNNKNKIDDETLLSTLIFYNFNMRQTLISLNLAPKGGNYKRCHRLKKEYNNAYSHNLSII